MISSKSEMKIKNELGNLLVLTTDSDISSISQSVFKIIALIKDPDSTVSELKSLVEADPSLMARILKVANSALYSPRTNIYSIDQAVIWLGFEQLKDIALKQKICHVFSTEALIHGYRRRLLWDHSQAVALLAKMIWRKEFGLAGSDIYAAGLLHDIGIVVVDQFMHNEFRSALQAVENSEGNLRDVALRSWGYSQHDVSKELMLAWKLPLDICVAVGAISQPFSVADEYFKMAAVLHIAHSVCHSNGMGFGVKHQVDSDTLSACMEAVGLSKVSLDLIFKQFIDNYSQKSGR